MASRELEAVASVGAGGCGQQGAGGRGIAIRESAKVVDQAQRRVLRGVDDLDFFIGDEAIDKPTYSTKWPIRHGIIEDWDLMERFMEQVIFKYLRAEPEDHYFLMVSNWAPGVCACTFRVPTSETQVNVSLQTEPPLNTPENREYLAEIMFESFNVPGLYIAVQVKQFYDSSGALAAGQTLRGCSVVPLEVKLGEKVGGEAHLRSSSCCPGPRGGPQLTVCALQAVLALAASWTSRQVGERTLTGIVIDSGDGVTHAIPVAEGYVIGSCIKHIPIAGRDITYFIQQLLREREVGIPPEQSLETAKAIKEKYCYICPDIVREFAKYDVDPRRWVKQYTGVNAVNQRRFTVDVGYERFLGPEIFFHPEFANPDFMESISDVVDEVIQNCPIDVRRPLYKVRPPSPLPARPAPPLAGLPGRKLSPAGGWPATHSDTATCEEGPAATACGSRLSVFHSASRGGRVSRLDSGPGAGFPSSSGAQTPAVPPRRFRRRFRSLWPVYPVLEVAATLATVLLADDSPARSPGGERGQNGPRISCCCVFQNVVLSGGSTMFRDFGRRLQRDLKRVVDARLRLSEELSGGRIKPKPVEVQVVTHHMQRYAVWFGGSMLASTPEFFQVCHTKKDYEEYGPSICRHNPVFGVMS
ncbi:Actin-related protein 3C [Galemys pyrenaicus]|uniref:Actin-related protein 3C n=3 Tax=Amniota TaxID=32524 RepID=A0A8J6DFW2_GALPY|nr:Actin-related protein 3C [Galemys pyrenaicus]